MFDKEIFRYYASELWDKVQDFFLLKQEAYDGILVEQSWKTVGCVKGNTEIQLPQLDNIEEISVEMYHADGTIVHQVNLRVENLLFESTNTTHREILLDSIHNSQTFVTYYKDTNTIVPNYCEGEEVDNSVTTTVRIKETLQTGTTNLVASRIKYDNEVSGMNTDNVQGAIDEVSRTLGYTVTSKNYLPNNSVSTGIFTVNNDKTVTVNGKGTIDPWTNIYFIGNYVNNDYKEIKGLEDGVDYIYTCCPSGASTDSYQGHLFVVDKNNTISTLRDNGEGVTFTHHKGNKYSVSAGVKYNYQATNILLKPMISKEGGEYEPYVADLKSLVCDVEKIYYNSNITSSSSAYQTVYTYKAKKRCLFNASISAIYTGSAPTGVQINDNNEVLTVVADSNGMGAMSTSISTILEAGKSLFFQARHASVSTNNNNIRIVGYVQYLE